MEEMNIEKIMEILPHRYPMLMVDKIIECKDNKSVVGLKNLSINEPFFQGHFPGRPVMPGVLQLEAMAQVSGILVHYITGKKGYIPLLLAINKARFRKRVCPGDQMRIEVRIMNQRKDAYRVAGKVFVDGNLVSEAELLFMFTSEKADL